MALSNSSVYDICEELKYKFLFNNDLNCIHMLLNIYDLEDNINNISPKYISMDHIRRHISRYLKDRRGNYLIALNLCQIIHDDINRLELFLYLEGYKSGYLNNKWVNTLEELTIKHYKVEDLYNMKYLFHFHSSKSDIIDIKTSIDELHKEEDIESLLYKSITNYLSHIIKPKVFMLNKYLDKQLTIEYNSEDFNIKEDETLLTLENLDGIYREVAKIVLKYGLKLYKEAFWNGINDRVLQRYR